MHRRKFLYRGTLAMGALMSCEQYVFGNDFDRVPNIKSIIGRIDKLLPTLLRKYNVPGLSIALVDEGKNVWSRGYGVCGAGNGKPVNADTVFEIASISKTVFAYAVIKLCEDGVMALDTPLVTYWPQLPQAMQLENDPRVGKITARHILSHQSGLQDWRTSEAPLKLSFDPGKGFMYSGEGYYHLQFVVTRLRGTIDSTQCGNYEAGHEVCATDIGPYLEKQVTVPMKMQSSGYVITERQLQNYALPHDVTGKIIAKSPQNAIDLARYAAAGGLLSTVNDYAKFMIAQFSPEENSIYKLKATSLAEMHRPQVVLPPDQKIDGASAWALGWAVRERFDGNVLVHSGGQTGYRSLAMVSSFRKSGFVMLSNSDNGGYVLYNEELGKILEELFTA